MQSSLKCGGRGTTFSSSMMAPTTRRAEPLERLEPSPSGSRRTSESEPVFAAASALPLSMGTEPWCRSMPMANIR